MSTMYSESPKDCDEEWLQFCNNDFGAQETTSYFAGEISDESRDNDININETAPECGNIYISTKTKIGYFSKELDIQKIFWDIDIIPYQSLKKGIIKKQIKIATNDDSYIEFVEDVISKSPNCEVQNLAKGKSKFVKKISIGTSKKDLISYRSKKKGAFYNCFVLMFRIKTEDGFKEMHVKFFNTGKIEIPGIKNDILLNNILGEIYQLFNKKLNLNIKIKEDSFKTVLINSNFNCGFCINREKLVDILKGKYCLSTSYDPCSYPGIMSKFYYNDALNTMGKITVDYINQPHNDNNNVLSFMIFRTGSILIVGKFSEDILYKTYDFIKNILKDEYSHILQKGVANNNECEQEKTKKKVKRTFVYT